MSSRHCKYLVLFAAFLLLGAGAGFFIGKLAPPPPQTTPSQYMIVRVVLMVCGILWFVFTFSVCRHMEWTQRWAANLVSAGGIMFFICVVFNGSISLVIAFVDMFLVLLTAWAWSLALPGVMRQLGLAKERQRIFW